MRTAFRDDEILVHGVAHGEADAGAAAAARRRAVRDGGRVRARHARRAQARLADALGGVRVSLGRDVDTYRRAIDGECSPDDLARSSR